MSDPLKVGEGPLSRVAAYVYTLIVIELLLLLTAAPGLVPIVFLARDASNLVLVGVCLIPLGPALSAALYALYHHRGDLADLHPARAFWRGYRLNFRGVLWIWIPLLVWLTIIAVNLANYSAAGIPLWWAVLLAVIGFVATLWGINALVITSLYSFRIGDLARLAVYFLPRTFLGNVSVLLVAAAVTAFASEAVLVLLGSVFLLGLLVTSRSMIAAIREEFVA